VPWNFPPSVRTKNHILLLWSILPQGTKGSDLQYYLKPLVEFLKQLGGKCGHLDRVLATVAGDGFEVYNAFTNAQQRVRGFEPFDFGDYPAMCDSEFSIIIGLITASGMRRSDRGYCACCKCRHRGLYSTAGRTNFYPGASLFIPVEHPLRDSLHGVLEEMYQEHLGPVDACS
jgi:hypothetical protein